MKQSDYVRKAHQFSRLVINYAEAIIEGKIDTSEEYHALLEAYCEALKGDKNEKKES